MRTRVACRAIAGAVALAVCLGVAREARADDQPPVSLEWMAPTGCPTRSDVLAAVDRILGGAGGTRQAVVARAVVSRVGPGQWQVRLTTRSGDSEGERSVGARSCTALGDAVALILALAANPERGREPVAAAPIPTALAPSAVSASGTAPSVAPGSVPSSAPTSPLPSSGAPTTPTPAATPSPPAATSPPRAAPPASPGEPPTPAKAAPAASAALPARSPHRLALTLSGVAALGPLPNLATGGEATLGVRLWRLRFETGATYWASQATGVPGSTTETADFSMVSALGRGGYAVSLGPFDLVPSLLVEADFVSSVALHVTRSLQASTTWLALGGGGCASWSITREIAVRLGVEVALPLARPTFQVTQGAAGASGGAAVFHFQPSPIGGKGAIGLELRFL